jgi:hypothetical protein
MGADHFVKVFDVLDSGYRDWTFPAFGLIFVAIGTVIFFFPKILKALGIPYLNSKSRWQTVFRFFFLGFALFWTTLAFFTTYGEHLRHQALARDNRCRVVEGPVENFVPMPVAGHAYESFSVAGVPFRYSDFVVTDGFNNSSSQGGPISKDSYVRICYDPAGNVILRLKIRNFSGVVKDYSKAGGIFPGADETPRIAPNPPFDVAWYGNLFMALYIADFLATQVLFLPYMRIFLRLKTVSLRDSPLKMRIEADQKIKLRNNLIRRDGETGTIWLRPRGFNRYRLPHVVAALNLDPTGKAITGYEIRFSSGTVVVFMLFLWTAYRMLSVVPVKPGQQLPPPFFLGIVAVFFPVAAFFGIRMLISRMKELVADALSELGRASEPTGRMTATIM